MWPSIEESKHDTHHDPRGDRCPVKITSRRRATRAGRAARLRPVCRLSARLLRTTRSKRIDGRSPEGRRFRDLCLSLATDLGGVDEISDSTALLIRQAATLSVHLERLQARLATGDSDIRTISEVSRLANVHGRALRALGIRKPVAKKRTIQDYLAERAASMDAKS